MLFRNVVALTLPPILLMLMLMAPEDNSNLGQSSAPVNSESGGQLPASPEPVQPISVTEQTTAPTPQVSSVPVVSKTSPVPPGPTPDVDQYTVNAPPATSDKPTMAKKPHFKLVLTVIILVALFAGSTTAAFLIGKHKRIIVTLNTTQPIILPPSAIVTAACVPGRGKQYIIPKDIPEGPIYDVENNKVIAIEYLVDLQQLESNSNEFSSTLLQLTKNYQVDHFSVVPVQAPAGSTDAFIHLIMFVVSPAEANSITCAGTSTSTGAGT